MTKLVQVMNHNVLREIIDESKPVEQIVDELYHKGAELCRSVSLRSYKDWDDFKRQHSDERTELVELEGPSDLGAGDVVVLRTCPIADEMSKLNRDGKSPDFHAKIVQDYMEQNPGSNSVLHPGCIAHQVARQFIVKSLRFENGESLNFSQLACRSGKSGNVVYDDNGLKAIGMSKERAKKLVDGFGCLYVMSRCPVKKSDQLKELKAR
jgi:hypothetical protein